MVHQAPYHSYHRAAFLQKCEAALLHLTLGFPLPSGEMGEGGQETKGDKGDNTSMFTNREMEALRGRGTGLRFH